MTKTIKTIAGVGERGTEMKTVDELTQAISDLQSRVVALEASAAPTWLDNYQEMWTALYGADSVKIVEDGPVI